MEIAYVAKLLAQGKSVSKIRALHGSHLEPTWGDLTKANLIVTGIESTNQAQLLTAFGGGFAIKDLQLCRNASAHLTKDLLRDVNAAKVRSEEHTSELQSLMRISYAVFCLQNNKKIKKYE